jgi:hypothetical protein
MWSNNNHCQYRAKISARLAEDATATLDSICTRMTYDTALNKNHICATTTCLSAWIKSRTRWTDLGEIWFDVYAIGVQRKMVLAH